MVEVADIAGYNWNWNNKYEAEMVEELLEAFTKSFFTELPNLPPDVIRDRGEAWAQERAASQIKNISDTTKARVLDIVEEAVETGQSIVEMTAKLQKDHIFSPEKAKVIARTETARALGVGIKEAAQHEGRDEKRWVTSGDIEEFDVCVQNAAEDWIPIGNTFSSGDDTIPAHPNCRCNVRYRTKAISPEERSISPEFRCASCNHLLGRDVSAGTRILCRHCKAERIAV
jgi:hypothetical protein